MTDNYSRLFISPFSPDLFAAIVHPSQATSARNISYHQIQTSPEHGYGYVDLPSMAADKVKQKFNGAILKGNKLKIESARPLKRRRLDAEAEDGPKNANISVSKSAEGKSKTRVDDHNVLGGYEIDRGRKVKRGWTDPDRKSKKHSQSTTQPASKYSEKEELLFRTNPPPNKSETPGSKTEKREKRQAKGQVVHEFATNVTQPSFLRVDGGTSLSSGVQYVDGQGWVNGDGDVVEPEMEQSRRTRLRAAKAGRGEKGQLKQALQNESLDLSDATSASSLSSSSSSPSSAVSDTSSSGSSDISDESVESAQDSTSTEQSEESESDTTEIETGIASGNSPAETTPIATRIPTIVLPAREDKEKGVTKLQSDIHPLEALFKKPKVPSTTQELVKPSLEISTSFSFFDELDAEDADEDLVVPMTPFSSQDMRNRGLRSAAPTPDTAHPSRFSSLGSGGLLDDEEMERSGEYFTHTDLEKDGPSEAQGREILPQISDFEKKFWENRGDNNRAWKLRRRTVLKEKRQRENRARRPKNW